jgi:hypothetical protein
MLIYLHMPRIRIFALVFLQISACSEPSVQVTFEIPEDYRPGQNDQCMKNCDAQLQQCQEPGPDEQECNQIFEDCRRECGEQNPDCENECQMQLNQCLEGQLPPENQEQCLLLHGECMQDCEEGIMAWSSLQVLKPPVANAQGEGSFGCEDLAFSEVPAEVLRASIIEDVTLQTGRSSEPLAGIDRKGRKLFLARAFDSGDKPVVAACREIGDIYDDVHVRLTGEPASVLTLYMQEYQDWVFGAKELPDPVELLATDVFNDPLQNLEVHWNVVGPGGKGSNDRDVTKMDGRLTFNPQTPSDPGPAILEIVARWQRDPTPLIKAFRQPAVLEGNLPDSKVIDIQLGRIGPGGQRGYAGTTYCGTPTGICLFYSYYQDGRMTWQQLVLSELENQESVALGIVEGATSDRVIVLGAGKWLELNPAGGTMIERPFESVSGPVWALPAGDCSPTAGGEVLVAFGDGSSGVFGPDGGSRLTTHPFSNLQLWGSDYFSGCAADQDGVAHRLLLGRQEDAFWRIFADVGGLLVQFDWVAQLRGVGFSPSTDSRAGHLLVGRLGQDSPEIVRLRLLHQPSIGPARLEEVSSAPLFSVPEAIGAGDMDDDDALDVVGLFSLENSERFAHAILGHTHKDKPVSGMLSVGFSQEPARLWLADFDGNGADDMAVMRELDCQPAENEQCLQQCEEEYRICLEGQEPHHCEELFLECNQSCELELHCIQYMDIYLMGS